MPARDSSARTWPIGTAGLVTGPADVRPTGAPASATLPQAWHSPHRPTHFAVSHPHSEHRKEGRGRAVDLLMAATLCHPTDNPGQTAPVDAGVATSDHADD
ncbi:hypothetical protein GCM10027273_12810 [Nocardioides pakistanensis]